MWCTYIIFSPYTFSSNLQWTLCLINRIWYTEGRIPFEFRPRHAMLTMHIWFLHKRLLIDRVDPHLALLVQVCVFQQSRNLHQLLATYSNYLTWHISFSLTCIITRPPSPTKSGGTIWYSLEWYSSPYPRRGSQWTYCKQASQRRPTTHFFASNSLRSRISRICQWWWEEIWGTCGSYLDSCIE